MADHRATVSAVKSFPGWSWVARCGCGASSPLLAGAGMAHAWAADHEDGPTTDDVFAPLRDLLFRDAALPSPAWASRMPAQGADWP